MRKENSKGFKVEKILRNVLVFQFHFIFFTLFSISSVITCFSQNEEVGNTI